PSQNLFHARRSSLRRHAPASRKTRPSSGLPLRAGQRRERSTRLRRSCEKPPICGRLVIKLERGFIEPSALSDETSVLVLEPLYAAIDFCEPLGWLGVAVAAFNV